MTSSDDAPRPMLIPPAGGPRQQWADLPASIRAGIEERLGATVVSARSQAGGFSPGLAAIVATTTGDRAFVKAVGPEPNPTSPLIHRREALVAAYLPADAPVARLRWDWDTGGDGWVVLAFDVVEGRQPAIPWVPAEVDLVLSALDHLSAALTPSPVPEAVVGRVERWGVLRGSWWLRTQLFPPDGLDRWSARHLSALVELERAAPDAAAGETLLHLDLRADNLLIGPAGVTVVDWPHARLGAAWVDRAFLAPSLAMQGGPSPESLMGRGGVGPRPDEMALTAVVAAMAGFFTWQALEPPPPGLPTLRAFQAAQGAVARSWLARRTGLG